MPKKRGRPGKPGAAIAKEPAKSATEDESADEIEEVKAKSSNDEQDNSEEDVAANGNNATDDDDKEDEKEDTN